MDKDAFWRLIDEVRTSSPDNEGMLEALRSRLESMTTEDVAAFQGHFDACMDELYRWDVWGAAYVMNGGCSDDSFEYWRAMLISLGRAAYDKALADPDALADLPLSGEAAEGEWDFEDLLYLANDVYEAKTGEQIPVSREGVGEDPAGEPWDEDTVSEQFPKIAARFWGD